MINHQFFIEPNEEPPKVKREELDKMMEDFLKNGGNIQKLPPIYHRNPDRPIRKKKKRRKRKKNGKK